MNNVNNFASFSASMQNIPSITVNSNNNEAGGFINFSQCSMDFSLDSAIRTPNITNFSI
jgi:hypothetical protein